jgi:cysteine desulfurase
MDHHASTPTDPEVLEAMLPYFVENFGNPSSATHVYGAAAREATERARGKVAELLGAESADEIIFTSGATESDNLAIAGMAYRYRDKGRHIITCSIEHKAVLQACRRLELEGYRVTYLQVNKEGLVDPDNLKRAICRDTILISIQYANSEVGTIQPLETIGNLARQNGIPFHTDAVQAVGKIGVHVQKLNADLLSLSAHKMYGPKGVGALYVRRHLNPIPVMVGGLQEKGWRAGTLNVPGIVGLGKACEIARRDLEPERRRLMGLRDRLSEGILKRVGLAYLNGHSVKRLPNNVNISFEYVNADALIESIPEVAVSSGSACTSQSAEPSYVLLAMGLPKALALSAIRFGLGKGNNAAQIQYVVELFETNVKQLRNLSPLYEGKGRRRKRPASIKRSQEPVQIG